MRLFVALLPPPDVLDELETFLGPLRETVPGLRWTRRELLHVTLAFLGDVEDRALDRLIPRLQRASARHDRLRLSLAGGGAFPGGGAHARVLWTGLYGDRRDLAGLAASTAAAGRRAGTLPDRHSTFRPHLTLARSRHPVDVRPLLEPMSSFAGTPWTADSVHLVRSLLPAKGRTQVEYEPLESWPLRAPR
ncbi:RNA 2',3'-cyclic phosphodiesterase [Actinomadura logoneensis]|uniref:RNA 2',3'-cyclic phosphodiesterase n=1 Tax=Actinomadura logoneensis TaxID=2293572 RepID=A0A372JRI3_9ACTN|nr:RNA 2',3'-cyclic phosphodiesterase [Actinomadura logoneensis]RFU42645.1 RNA 2',3'-cyclic phosphodiesterase [Actinomadura logoneensis]